MCFTHKQCVCYISFGVVVAVADDDDDDDDDDKN